MADLRVIEGTPAPYTCPDHGGYGVRDGSECRECKREAHQQSEEWRRDWEVFEHWRDESGLGARHRSCTLANFLRDSQVLRAVGKAVDLYADKLGDRIAAGDGLVLLGPPGVGKTHLLAALVTEAHLWDRLGFYASWPDVLSTIKGGFGGGDSGPGMRILNRLKNSRFVTLDELGLKAASEYDAALLFEVVDHRYREGLATVYASNATKATLPQAVGERVADRLAEAAPTLALSGTSRRGSPIPHRKDPPALSPPPDDLVLVTHTHGTRRENTLKHEDSRGKFF